MPITAVQDRLELDRDIFMHRLHIPTNDPSFPASVWSHYSGLVKEVADNFLCNPFVDENGEEMNIPKSISEGCYALLASIYMRRLPGVLQDEAGSMKISYDPATLDEDILKWWRPYKLYPGLGISYADEPSPTFSLK